jgi:rhamnulose-1-phosphate aldolase/alcohol dehydrogenase
MQSRYDDAEAERAIEEHGQGSPELALRVYTSRLIGSEPTLVLHGGGNTSAKGRAKTILGDEVDVIWVKGSGSSLDRVVPRDFPMLDLAYLRRLRTLAALADEEMVNQLRTHLFDASAPNPSVEALLHAFLPHRFVDHSHANVIVAITNQPDGERNVREALGDSVAFLPYIMPGFPLAKAVIDVYEKRPSVVGVVLAKHGLFTFGDTAKESYERHIDIVDQVERFIDKRAVRSAIAAPRFDEATRASRAALAAPILRGALTRIGGKSFVLEYRHSAEADAFMALPDAVRLAATGPLTPDHVIRTKAQAVFIPDPAWGDPTAIASSIESAIDGFALAYDAAFARENARVSSLKKKLDAAPRVVLLGGAGIFAFGASQADARIAADIAEHTLSVKRTADALGRYEPLSDSDLFDMEYWSLEQAKLGKTKPRALEGKVALITGGAGAIGRGIAEVLAEAGAAVMIADIDEQAAADAASAIAKTTGAAVRSVAMDVTNSASVRDGLDATCRAFGGVDVVVPNAGVALVKPISALTDSEALRVSEVNYIGVLNTIRESAKVFEAQGLGGAIVVNASKNVFAPGKDFGAYSASKAAAHQLAKIAAIELAPIGVRVNMINADAVFSHGDRASGLWSEVLPARAKSRGISEEEMPAFYRERSLLKESVSARDVGRAVLFLASDATKTTGATLPVDGGVPEAFPR